MPCVDLAKPTTYEKIGSDMGNVAACQWGVVLRFNQAVQLHCRAKVKASEDGPDN